MIVFPMSRLLRPEAHGSVETPDVATAGVPSRHCATDMTIIVTLRWPLSDFVRYSLIRWQGADPRTRKALGGGSLSPGGQDNVGCRERLARGMSPSGKTVRGVSSSPGSRDARDSREGLSRTMTPSPAARRRGSSLAPSSTRSSRQSCTSSTRRQLGEKRTDRRRAPSSPPIRG